MMIRGHLLMALNTAKRLPIKLLCMIVMVSHTLLTQMKMESGLRRVTNKAELLTKMEIIPSQIIMVE